MKPTKKSPLPSLIDEKNIARLGIVSIQTRLKADEVKWQSSFTIEGRKFRVEGRASDGRPRGGDTNVLIGIESLFAQRNTPEDNWLHTTAYELREASFLSNNGRSYHKLRESLLRLWSTGFIVSEGWVAMDGRIAWSNQTLRLLERISYWDVSDSIDIDRERELLPNATLSIKLGDQLADSIRAGYTQALDGRLLHQIEQPPARALYRLLEAHRYGETGVKAQGLTVALEDWRVACGINAEKPSRVMRLLEEAHAELIERDYLVDVKVEGTRSNTTIRYLFQTGEEDVNPALVADLRRAGVSAPKANTLARDYPARVPDALAFLAERRALAPGGVRNPAGLLIDFLESDGKYVVEIASAEKPASATETERRAQQRAQQQAAEQAAHHAYEEAQQTLLALSPEQQWAAARPTLKTLLGRRLSQVQWDTLEQRCLAGDLQAAELARTLSARLLHEEFTAIVADLEL